MVDMQLSVWLAPLIALAVAVIAALLNGMQLIVGKENKVSEFRQDWINAQRSDLAEAVAMAEAIRRTTDPEKMIERLARFDEAHARIELRENPTKPEWTDARAALDGLRREILSAAPTVDKVAEHRSTVLSKSRPPLKDNWTVVKNGETWFSVFKTVYALLIAILVAIVAGWMIVSAFKDDTKPVDADKLVVAPPKHGPEPSVPLLNPPDLSHNKSVEGR